MVADRTHNPGEQVAAGDVVLELFDPRSLYVVAHVPAERAGDVRAGLPVEVRVGSATVPGEVRALLSAVTPDALTVPVRVELTAPLEPPLLNAAAICRIRAGRASERPDRSPARRWSRRPSRAMARWWSSRTADRNSAP